MKKMLSILTLTLMVSACASPISQQTKQTLEAPVNCNTAIQDLAILEQSRAGTSERVTEGITTIVPVGLVASVASGNTQDKIDVSTGKHNVMIDMKINDIKYHCNLI